MASPASHDVRVVKRSALAGVAGVGRRHTRQPRRHVSPRRRRARRPVLPRSNLYLIEVYCTVGCPLDEVKTIIPQNGTHI